MNSIDLDTTEHDEKVAALEARVEEMQTLLEALHEDHGWCPFCNTSGYPHDKNCRLRAALENI